MAEGPVFTASVQRPDCSCDPYSDCDAQTVISIPFLHDMQI